MSRFLHLYTRGLCAQQALSQAAPGNGRGLTLAWQRLIDQVPGLRRQPNNTPEYWTTLARYNDAPATTHADVLALYDRAIAELEG